MPTERSTRTILVCKEFEPVDVPLDQLIVDGRIQIYAGVDKFFDIDYRGSKLVVASKSYVGVIPINDRLVLRVLPRFPIQNLFYLLRRASAKLSFIEGELRAYGLLDRSEGDPLELLAERFVRQCETLLRNGLAPKYIDVEQAPLFRGTLDLATTIVQHWARGDRKSQVWREADLTVNTPENGLIKAATSRVLAFYQTDRSTAGVRARSRLGAVMRLFDGVDSSVVGMLGRDESVVRRMVATAPAHRPDYGPLLWISYLLHEKRGLAVESTGGLRFDTFVVNLSEVFEDYVRALLREHLHAPSEKVYVRDGNIDQVPLFRGTNAFQVKPDIYVVYAGKCAIVLDAKYKLTLKAADRYEILAFCEALSCKLAVLISPKSEGARLAELGRTPRGVSVWRAQIDLSRPNMPGEEAEFLAGLDGLLSDVSGTIATS